MQLFPILIVGVVIAADRGAGWGMDQGLDLWQSLVLVWGPIAFILAASAVRLRRLARDVDLPGGQRAFRQAERLALLARAAVILSHALSVLGLGWLHFSRRAIASLIGGTGDLVMLDELVAMLPAMVGVVGLWWAYYPIELKLRERLAAGAIDSGQWPHALPGRWTYVLMQARLHLALLMAPLLLILAASEIAGMLMDDWARSHGRQWVTELVRLAGAALVFVFAPLVVRGLLDVHPVPPGEMRRDLAEICRRHAVRVREILIWRTQGTVINAAVMGILGRFRYVLLTDGLIEAMRKDELRAVMAHEVAHVRRRHIPWMIVSLVALMMLGVFGATGILVLADWLGIQWDADAQRSAELLQQLLPLLVTLLGFGWVSRRMERQADTFAVQDLSRFLPPGPAASPPMDHPPLDSARPLVTSSAVCAMMNALEVIARLHMVDVRRPSWRHGSILWRQEYLGRLVGLPVNAMRIDRQIRWIKLGSAALALAGLLALWKLGLVEGL